MKKRIINGMILFDASHHKPYLLLRRCNPEVAPAPLAFKTSKDYVCASKILSYVYTGFVHRYLLYLKKCNLGEKHVKKFPFSFLSN